MTFRGFWSGAVLTVVCLTTGCSETTDVGAAASASDMSPEQSAALEDGAVSRDEYREGARRFVGCLAARGHEVVESEESDDDLVRLGIPESAVSSGDEQECYEAEWKALDTQWQVEHAETSASAQLLADCLENNGLPVPATAAEKTEAVAAAELDCP